ncbi:alpha/beta hydrolase [Gemmatimonas sp.]|uniref:alpha/beta hydrolase n=1 Tax=Gemmatimonas sp. TaxID=1962908 RepID=UPI003DA39BB4
MYTPPQYDSEPARRFPVLYWLHGSGGGLGGIAILTAYFDDAIRAGRTPPMLVVFPNGMASSMWADSKDGRVPMESMVVRDLVPHVDATFRTVATRDGRLLEGFSMGGLGASRWGLRYPEVFGAMSMFAAGPLDLDFNGPRATGNLAERAQILRDVYSDDMTYYVAQNPFTVAEQVCRYDTRDIARADAFSPSGRTTRLHVAGQRRISRACHTTGDRAGVHTGAECRARYDGAPRGARRSELCVLPRGVRGAVMSTPP